MHRAPAPMAPPVKDDYTKAFDYACRPGTMVYSAISGVVMRLGYPYKDNDCVGLVEGVKWMS
jgi:hypothetical protein